MANTQKLQSKVGALEWCVTSGDGKENMSGVMQYIATVVLEGEEAEAQKAAIDTFWADNRPKHIKKAKSTGYYPHTEARLDDEGEPLKDPDTDTIIRDETGKTAFVFKTGVAFKDGKPKVVKIFNRKGKEVSLGEKQIGNGSQGRIDGAMGTYEVKPNPGAKATQAGVALYLNGIQLAKFVEYTGNGPSFSGIDGDYDGDDGMDSLDDADTTSKVEDQQKPEL